LPIETDLLIVGGGINGAGIARDAAGRGLRVILVEQGDLGGGTSSASSKLIHGGLRYLEHLQFTLVSEALREREVLLRAAPHLVHPLRFVMPDAGEVRPGWMIRSGLFLYDLLARGRTLPGSGHVRFNTGRLGVALKPQYTQGYAYSDCWVDDARLVIANARGAADLGARILPRTRHIKAQRAGEHWEVVLQHGSREIHVRAKCIVNATGARAARVRAEILPQEPARKLLKLVQGSHVVVPRLYEGDHAFILQNEDRRVIFVYGYEHDYTLVGTTEVELDNEDQPCRTTEEEIDYLCRAANRYFRRQVSAADVTWSYCGVRALVDDGTASASNTSREYLLRLDGQTSEPPLLTVLGGKITTYRRLAERALEKLKPWFGDLPGAWTATAALPGGDLPGGVQACTEVLGMQHPTLDPALIRALVLRHGSHASAVLGEVSCVTALGQHYGADLYEREVDYFIDHEWAVTAEDVLWRRSKAGLHLSLEQQAKLRGHMERRAAAL
jgi:glycerol-3-phosphate dehydrogenase